MKHILYDLPCGNYILTNDLSTMWECFETKCDKRKHLKRGHRLFFCSHLRIFKFRNFFHFGSRAVILLGLRNNPWH